MRLATEGLLAALAALTIVATHAAGQDRFVFEASADAVHLDVVVTSGEGRYVPGLTVDDFEIFEDGILQSPTYFTAETTPVNILLLVDVSSSIRPSLDGIKAGAYRFLRGLQKGDRMMIGFFNHDLWFTYELTDDLSVLASEIQQMRAGGLTALYDAILSSLEELSSVSGRKALVVFADGDDSRPAAAGSTASRADALEGGRASDVSIYTVGFEGSRAAGRGVNKGFLRQLSNVSGGRAYFPRGAQSLERAFATIQTELHSQYRLAYSPLGRERDGAWRQIDVRIKSAAHLTVRTREGYYAESEP